LLTDPAQSRLAPRENQPFCGPPDCDAADLEFRATAPAFAGLEAKAPVAPRCPLEKRMGLPPANVFL
jgi:hypothetical protein